MAIQNGYVPAIQNGEKRGNISATLETRESGTNEGPRRVELSLSHLSVSGDSLVSKTVMSVRRERP